MVDTVTTPWVELEQEGRLAERCEERFNCWLGGAEGLVTGGPEPDGSHCVPPPEPSARTSPPWSVVAPGIFTASCCLGGFRSVVSSFLVKSPSLV